MSSYVFPKPAVCEQYPAIGGGAAHDLDAFAATDQDRPTGGRVTRADADRVVSSVGELDDDVPPGSVVWLESDAVIDAGSRSWTFDNADVTIASGRGIDGSQGALIRTDNRTSHQFLVRGDGVRITGIRFRGPEPDSFGTPGYDASEAISVNAAGVEIDNCVARGWTHAAIEIGPETPAQNTHIHHNDLVDNNSTGLGYGVTVFHGHPLIQANYFDNNRHSVAGDGADDCGWTTRHCIGGEHHVLHAWDQHEDRSDRGNAGTRMVLEQNILLNTHNWYGRDGPSRYRQETVSIRSIPRDAFVCRYNVFRNRKPTEPMRDHNNTAFNVMHADSFAEGKVEGVDLNTYEWETGDPISEGMGPTRETAVTGFDAGGARDGGSGGGGGDTTFGPPGDTMDNPTSNRGDDEQYDVTLKGTGNVSQYALTAKTGVAFPRKEESQDRIEGRTAHGQLSTLDDVVRCTGPITALAVTSGDPAMRVEIESDGETYTARDFPDRETAAGTGTVEATLTVGGSTYTLSGDVTEQ